MYASIPESLTWYLKSEWFIGNYNPLQASDEQIQFLESIQTKSRPQQGQISEIKKEKSFLNSFLPICYTETHIFRKSIPFSFYLIFLLSGRMLEGNSCVDFVWT